jgi:hypothetical protein
MSTYNKMKKRRDHWKKKTVATGADLRYHKKENKRIKKERDAYRRAWRDTQKELDELKQRNTALAACDKTTTVFLALQLFVVARIGFRAISRVLGVLASQLGLAQAPCPQTIINWVTRLAIARMKEDRFGVDPDTGMQRFSQGFILLLDATIGFGQGKIMTVLALDARHYACNAGAPSLQHVSCVAVSVADTWTGESIAALLQRVIATIGRPVAYLKDGGTDLGKAVRLLQEKGLGGVSIDDLSHVVANLVKHAYRAHPMFDIFLSTCGKVSSMLKQSVLACLAPPKVSTKARFMNLHRLVKWAARVLQQSPRGRAANGSLLQIQQRPTFPLPPSSSLLLRAARPSLPSPSSSSCHARRLPVPLSTEPRMPPGSWSWRSRGRTRPARNRCRQPASQRAAGSVKDSSGS